MERAAHLFIDVRMKNHSGIGTYLRNITRRILRELPEDGYSLLGSSDGADLAAPHERFRPFRAPIYSIGEQLRPLRFGVRRSDVYWCPHYNFPLLLRCRRVVTVHDLLHLAMPEFAGGALKQGYAKLFFSRIAASSAKVICVSKSTADELIRLTGIASDRIEVIHNGVDAFWLGGATGERPIPAPYFLFVGNVKPHKNLRRLIAAMRWLASDFPTHQLVIVGKRDGFISGDPEAVRDAESMPGKVTFTGYVPEAVLKSYFQHAEALVFPSLYEGFGLPVVEAMACGCPVIASGIPVHREICGDTAVFCDPQSVEDISDQMRLVSSQSFDRQGIIEAARSRARQFSWDRCAEATLRVLGS